MDAISYSYADKQAKRIKKFINDPDSTSGVLTVPKVITSGENITVPSGRVAILPNVQIDGTLNVQGEVFIPSGSSTSTIDTQLATKAPLASPALTGTPTAPTASAGTNNTQVATTAYVDGKMVRMTAQNSTSGTSIDFTGIPFWAKRITVMFSGVSTNGTTSIQVQLGAGSVQTTGYKSSANNYVFSTTGLLATSGAAAANNYQGSMIISFLGASVWVSHSVVSRDDANTFYAAGSVTLSGTLDRVRITTFGGTDTFDAGQINIMYEG